MDPISDIASIIALIAAAYQVVDYLSDLKDGGRERMRLLAEVTNFCCALDNLKELLENDSQSSESNEKIDEKWTKAVSPLLRDGLLEQCNEVVSTLVKRLAPKGGKARLFQHLRWTFTKTEVHEAVERLHRLQTIINNVLSQISISLSQQIRDDAMISRQILEDQEAQDIRNWLSPLDFTTQQEAIFANHCPGTGSRFLKSEEYKCWKTADRSAIWCCGVPGAGKTYLSSIVVNELQQKNQAFTDAVLVIYCRYDDPECQSISNIAGELLRQCTRDRQLPKALVELFRGHHSSAGTRPTYDVLFSLLSECLGSYRKVFVVLDALDEIAVSNDRKLLLESLWFIKTDISLMIMSRKFEDIRSHIISHIGLVQYLCDCCYFDDCRHCGECPKYDEYLYHCGKCIHMNSPPGSTITFDLCQRCYDAGVRCLGEAHKMERMLNCILWIVELDEDDMKCYLLWRMASDPSLKALIAKRDGLQDQIFDAVVRTSGSMFVPTSIARWKIFNCLQVPHGEADN